MSNTSVSFGRAAAVYDQTRPIFEPIITHGVQAILDIAGREAHILDAGTGTGRISIPLLERDANLVGIDLSAGMLLRLREKRPSARLVQANAVQLPFPGNHFGAVLTVHVMHLVDPWRQALREFRRLLRPGGVYLNMSTWESAGRSVREEIRASWRRWIAAKGIDSRHPGLQNRQELRQELQQMGVSLAQVEAVRFPLSYTLREELERFETRVYSDTWKIPDAIFAASLQELRAWTAGEYGRLHQQFEDQVRVVVDVARFAG